MPRRRVSFVVAASSPMFFLVAWLQTPPASAPIPWQMFHGTAQHTGESRYTGPHTATVKWTYRYQTLTQGTDLGQGKAKGGLANFVVDSAGRVYVNARGTLLALNAKGKVIWRAQVTQWGGVALSSDESTLYAVAQNRLYAYSSSGTRQWMWEAPTMYALNGEPAVAKDRTIYVGSMDTNVYALKPSGSLKWTFPTDGSIAPLASPTLNRNGKTIYVGSGDPNLDSGGTLFALSATGAEVWQKQLDHQRVSGVVVAPNGDLFATGMGRVFRLARDGTTIWESQEGTASSLAPSLSKSSIVYVGTGAAGKFFALEAASGSVLWSFQTGKNPDPEGPEYGVPTPPTIGADGVVYFGAMDRRFYALNPNGTLRWSYRTGGAINENGPAIGPDGTLYFSSEDGLIYAIRD